MNKLLTCCTIITFTLIFPIYSASTFDSPMRTIEVFPPNTTGTTETTAANAAVHSLVDAQSQARRMLAEDQTRPVDVIVHAGTYYLADTLRFGPEDSGTRYMASPGDERHVAISGGVRITTNWTPYIESNRPGIFYTKIDPAAYVSDPEAFTVDQLYVGGERMRMARYPNFDPASTEAFGGCSSDAFCHERTSTWNDPTGGYIHAMHIAEWGDYHYVITEKNIDGNVTYEGGFQNNRQMGMHPTQRFVENIFEELDSPCEWFYDRKTHILYFMAPEHMLTNDGTLSNEIPVETTRLDRLIELIGTPESRVHDIQISGFTFCHAARTFMQTKEPLLRSDWCFARTAAVFFEGTESCVINDCNFDQVGGNAICMSGYNRLCSVNGCHIRQPGASGVAFIGRPESVRNPLFEYHQRQKYDDISLTAGPCGIDYPQECEVNDCLIEGVGEFEKQSAGVQISMSRRISIEACTIHRTPRAGINISEGTFSGHNITHCDIFDTVRETGDHGSFNSWGRDRYWGLTDIPNPDRTLPQLSCLDTMLSMPSAKEPRKVWEDIEWTARMEPTHPTVIANNRWRCDRGWDVDLDDGSSNYVICNNLFLNGGLKLREGFFRRVYNNIAVNNTLHPHVWYRNSGDIVERNIWMAAYRPALMPQDEKWGENVDGNFFTSDADRNRFAANDCDRNSLVFTPKFVDPESGDFRLDESAPENATVLAAGFRNFPMNQFGVRSERLRIITQQPIFPTVDEQYLAAQTATSANASEIPTQIWRGLVLRNLTGEEFSAHGVGRDSDGVVVIQSVPRAPIIENDLIQSIDNTPIHTINDLAEISDPSSNTLAEGAPHEIGVVRDQKPFRITW